LTVVAVICVFRLHVVQFLVTSATLSIDYQFLVVDVQFGTESDHMMS